MPGGLLAAAIIAGADPRKCYGIELDPAIAILCRNRLANLGVPRTNVKIGNALDATSYDFSEPAKITMYFNIKDLGFNKAQIFIEKNEQNNLFQKTFIIDFAKSDDLIKPKFQILFKLFSLSNQNNIVICAEKLNKKMKFMNAFFNKYFKKKIQLNSNFIEI